jgi:hypothetical protein
MRDSRLTWTGTVDGASSTTTVYSDWLPLGSESSTADTDWVNNVVGNAQGRPSLVQPYEIVVHYPLSAVSNADTVAATLQTTVDDGTTAVDDTPIHASFTPTQGTSRTYSRFFVPVSGLKGVRVKFTLGANDVDLGDDVEVSLGYCSGDERGSITE